MPSFEEFAEQLTGLETADRVWVHTAGLAHGYGFTSCSLTMANKQPSGLRSTCLKSDLPDDFAGAYTHQGLIDSDPFLLFCCHSPTAKRVDDFSSFPRASPRHRVFLDQVATAGAASGIGVPVRTTDSDVFGGWLFSSSERGDAFHRLDRSYGREIHLAGVLAYERIAALDATSPTYTPILSGRERECLLWLCAGLRVSMIANRLSISESAVNLYIANAKRKLGARTREQAIAHAIFSGEISL